MECLRIGGGGEGGGGAENKGGWDGHVLTTGPMHPGICKGGNGEFAGGRGGQRKRRVGWACLGDRLMWAPRILGFISDVSQKCEVEDI